jgi:hypothetical protein
MEIALLTAMSESSPGREPSTPPSASSGAKWFEIALMYLPSLLKLLASLGLFTAAAKRRQNLVANRAAKRTAMGARPEKQTFWV